MIHTPIILDIIIDFVKVKLHDHLIEFWVCFFNFLLSFERLIRIRNFIWSFINSSLSKKCSFPIYFLNLLLRLARPFRPEPRRSIVAGSGRIVTEVEEGSLTSKYVALYSFHRIEASSPLLFDDLILIYILPCHIIHK